MKRTRTFPPKLSHFVCLSLIATWTLVGHVTGTYIASTKRHNSDHKSNAVNDHMAIKRYGSIFRHDSDIRHYLDLFGTESMIWRCKNAIQPYWHRKPLPVVELYCEAIGSMKAVHWNHNGKELPINVGNRFKQAIYPHHNEGHFFPTWIDFRLRIYNATAKDSGKYTFTIIGRRGTIDSQNIYVDISHRRRRRKDRFWRELYGRRHRKSGRA